MIFLQESKHGVGQHKTPHFGKEYDQNFWRRRHALRFNLLSGKQGKQAANGFACNPVYFSLKLDIHNFTGQYYILPSSFLIHRQDEMVIGIRKDGNGQLVSVALVVIFDQNKNHRMFSRVFPYHIL